MAINMYKLEKGPTDAQIIEFLDSKKASRTFLFDSPADGWEEWQILISSAHKRMGYNGEWFLKGKAGIAGYIAEVSIIWDAWKQQGYMGAQVP